MNQLTSFRSRKRGYRIWDNQSRNFVHNSTSLHCYSNWMIDLNTGLALDVVGNLDGDHSDSYSINPDPGWYMEDGKVIHESRYVITEQIGLVDCDGIEIYEGDIVDFNNSLISDTPVSGRFEIYYETDVTLVKSPGFAGISSHGVIPDLFGMIKIVGNVFEDPSLRP